MSKEVNDINSIQTDNDIYTSLDGVPLESIQDMKKPSDVFVSGFSDDEYEIEGSSHDSLPEVGDYILMLDGKIIIYGTSDLVLKEAKNILYGHSDKYKAEMNDVVILKRIGLKIGVFYDE